MKLSRLLGYLKGKLTEVMMTTREKKIKAALESAKVNAEEEKVNEQLQAQGFKGDIPTIEQKDILSQYRQMRDTARQADIKAKEWLSKQQKQNK